MRWSILLSLLILVSTSGAFAGENASVKKVLPQFVDLKGRHSLSPSLYERDAYQARLQKRPAERGGLRFAVLWRAKSRPVGTLKLRIETRSAQAGQPATSNVFEQPLDWKSSRSRWTEIAIRDEAYAKFGELTAWRVTLWDGDQPLAEARSFLW